MKTGIELIAEERKRQVEKEDWNKEHDSHHTKGELAKAAACYALPDSVTKLNFGFGYIVMSRESLWPWAVKWWKPSLNRVRELQKAGALIAAEIDRIQDIENGDF